MNRKTLVILAGALLLMALFALTFAPVPQVAAQGPTATPPVAVLKILPVAANPADPNVITYTLGATTTVNTGATGLNNVSVGVPVHLNVSVTDPKNPATKFAWTFTAPPGSKASIKDSAATGTTEFTPDIVGVYKVDVVASNAAGNGPMASVQIHVDTFVGATNGNCKQCHPDQAAGWAKTGHAKIMKEQLDNDPFKVYSETCAPCHSVGYNIGVKNGGWSDMKAKTGWTFTKGPGTFDKMPADLQNVSNIQCENCHGPAKDHATNHVPVMAASLDEGVCNVCHNGGGHHTIGEQLKNAAHADASSIAWNYPTGPNHQECVRCHSGKGYITFTENPTNMAAWNNEPHTVVCAVCHDPHEDKNPHQLRVFGKPIALPFDNPKDAGLSATCEECHNGRQVPTDALKGQFPHYSSIAEMMNSVAGVTYGQTVPDSPHGTMVGSAPIPDPSDKTGQAKLYGGAVPGPCVTCHMQPILTDSKDPNSLKVGGHSFNTVSPDGKFNYTTVCKTCHGDVKDFNLKAKADYCGDGNVGGVQDEIKCLLNTTWKALEAKGAKKNDAGYPYATLPKDASGVTDPKILNAWFNFRVVYGVMWGAGGPGNEGKAQAVHNFKRSCALLQLSLKDLTGALPNGATDCTK